MLVNEHRFINVDDVPWEADLCEVFVDKIAKEYCVALSQFQLELETSTNHIKADFKAEVWHLPVFIDKCFGAESYPVVRQLLSYYNEAVTLHYMGKGWSQFADCLLCHVTPFKFIYDFRVDDLSLAVAKMLDAKLHKEVECLKNRSLEVFYGLERELSHKLTALYKELISDEAVWETIVKMGLDKRKEISA